MKNKNLSLILTNHWFDQILSGRKKYEYRLVTPHWVKKLSGKSFQTITFSRGYTSTKSVFKCGKIELTTIKHDFFGNDPVAVFQIEIKDKIE